MKKLLLAAAILPTLFTSGHAATVSLTSPIFSGIVSTTQTVVLDMNAAKIDYLSLTAAYSSATLNAATLSDGAKSTATITVGNLASMSAQASSTTIIISSNPATLGATITFIDRARTITLQEGVQWFRDVNFSSNTALSIANAFNPYPFILIASTSSSSSVLVAASHKEFNNLFTISASTVAIRFSTGTFVGGQNAATLTINGVTKTANVDWTVAASSALTAINIMNAINADTSLNTIIVATATSACPGCGIVYTTSTALGVNNWSIQSSTPSLAVPASNQFSGGIVSQVLSGGILNLPLHGFGAGTPLLFTTTAGTPPGTLIANTTYYPVIVDTNNIKLATTQANALANPPVVLAISTQTANGGGIFKLTPPLIAGILSVQLKASDDGINYNGLVLPNNVTVSSVTLIATGAATSTYWDLGQINARYIQFVIGGPTFGGYNLLITPYGKSFANGN